MRNSHVLKWWVSGFSALVVILGCTPEVGAELATSKTQVWDWDDQSSRSAHAELEITADYEFDDATAEIIAGYGVTFNVALKNLSFTPDEATLTADDITVNGGKLGESGSFELGFYSRVAVKVTYKHEGFQIEQTFFQDIYPPKPFVEMTTTDQGDYIYPLNASLSGVPDIFNASFHVAISHDTAEGWDHLAPSPNVQARLRMAGSTFGTSSESSGWEITDTSGQVDLMLGSGSSSVSGSALYYAPELYIKVEPLMPDRARASAGYAPRLLSSRTLRGFDGKLTVKPRDPDGNTIFASVIVWGGKGFYYTAATSNDQGEIPAIHWPRADSDAEDKDLDVTVFPLVFLEPVKTQNIDNPAQVLDVWPSYLSPRMTLSDDAYTYMGGGLTSCMLKMVDGNDPDTVYRESAPDHPIKRLSDINLADLYRGRDRQYISVDVEDTPRNYSLNVTFPDRDEGAPDDEFVAGSTGFYVAKTHKPAKPVFQFEYVICRVGAWAALGERFHVDRIFNLNDMVTLSDEIQQFLPSPLLTTLNPSYRPKTGADTVFSFGSSHLEALAQGLQEYQSKTNTKVDLVIGIVPPGYLHTHTLFSQGGAAGLSFGSTPNAVLLDPSLTKSHHALHEFLHTLGLPDKDDDVNIAPSANGLDGKDPVINIPDSASYPQYQAIMYDHATAPFPDAGEYGRVMLFAAQSVLGGPKEEADVKFAKGATDKVITLRGEITGTTMEPTVNLLAPFVSEGAVFDPNGDRDYGDYYARVRRQNGENHIAYFDVSHPFANPYGEQWNSDRIVSFFVQLPWFDDVTDIDIGPSNSLGGMVASWKNVKPSENPPTVTITGPTESTLSGTVALTWQMSVTDNQAIDAMPMISQDEGESWEPIVGLVPYDWKTDYGVEFQTSDYPSGSRYKLRVLVTDGFHTSEATTPGAFTLQGYDPNPALELPLMVIDATLPAGPLTAPVILPVRNAGNGPLSVTLETSLLPPWLRLEYGKNAITLLPVAEKIFSLTADRPGASAVTGTLTLTSDDPVIPNASVPVTLASATEAIAPMANWVVIDPPQVPEKEWLNDTRFKITAYESTGGIGLDARVSIAKFYPYQVVLKDQPMDPGLREGTYLYTWEPSGTVGEGEYGVEISLFDPATGLSDLDGSNGEGWDALLYLKEPNQIPVFVTPSDPVTTIQGEVGRELVIPYEVMDPDGDEIDVAIHDSVAPIRWDKTAGEIRLVPRTAFTDTIYLTALDARVAMRTAEIDLDIDTGTNSPIANLLGLGIIDGKIFSEGQLTTETTAISTVEGQQGVRLEYRLAGADEWIIGALIPYDIVDLGYNVYWTAAVSWDLSGFAAGSEIEVRIVNIDAAGNPDPNAAILHVFIHSMAGELTSIDAPALVEAGQPFAIRVNVLNSSPYVWTEESSVLLRPVGGGDPFTSETEIRLPGLMQVPKDGQGYFEIFATAPSTPGDYVTEWELELNGQMMTPSLARTITVAAMPIPPSGSQTPTVTPTSDHSPTMTATPTSTLTLSVTQTPCNQYDVVPDCKLDSLDLLRMLATEMDSPNALFDFSRFWDVEK
ncbi:MAG: hypothetical protein KC964_21715 [Candidatus Omnitrophica bacterium]|nr:hypothetical protein [Candidatus Omnitrophota bacterium]